MSNLSNANNHIFALGYRLLMKYCESFLRSIKPSLNLEVSAEKNMTSSKLAVILTAGYNYLLMFPDVTSDSIEMFRKFYSVLMPLCKFAISHRLVSSDMYLYLLNTDVLCPGMPVSVSRCSYERVIRSVFFDSLDLPSELLSAFGEFNFVFSYKDPVSGGYVLMRALDMEMSKNSDSAPALTLREAVSSFIKKQHITLCFLLVYHSDLYLYDGNNFYLLSVLSESGKNLLFSSESGFCQQVFRAKADYLKFVVSFGEYIHKNSSTSAYQGVFLESVFGTFAELLKANIPDNNKVKCTVIPSVCTNTGIESKLNSKPNFDLKLSFLEKLEELHDFYVCPDASRYTEMPSYVSLSEVIRQPVYQELLNDPMLKGKVVLTAYGGSTAYGLNRAGSDTDVRGVFIPTFAESNVLTHKMKPKLKTVKEITDRYPNYRYDDFDMIDTYLNLETDTRFYTLKKFMQLLGDSNPDSLEMLFCKPEHRLVNGAGQKLVENRSLFISRESVKKSYFDYARGLFNQFQNALSGKAVSNRMMYLSTLIYNFYSDMEAEIPGFSRDMITFYFTCDEERLPYEVTNLSIQANYDVFSKKCIGKELFYKDKLITAENFGLNFTINNLGNLPGSLYNRLFKRLTTLLDSCMSAPAVNGRNRRPPEKMPKHGSCLVQLYMFAESLLLNGTLELYNVSHHNLLKALREGLWCHIDGDHVTFDSEYFKLLNYLEQRVLKAYEVSKLPATIDYKKVQTLYLTLLRENMSLID